MGLLVTQALAAKGLTAIYVANRTYERAVVLADKIGGRAVNFRGSYRYIALSDVVISCTAAPHPVIRTEEVRGGNGEAPLAARPASPPPGPHRYRPAP